MKISKGALLLARGAFPEDAIAISGEPLLDSKPMKETRELGVLCLGVSHFLIDFCCAFTVLALPRFWPSAGGEYVAWIIGYNVLAFGAQPLLGWGLDRVADYRLGALLGFALCGVGAAFAQVEPTVAVISLGLGNAMFHVGGGGLVYGRAPGRAALQGGFIAPGGIGLALGLFFGRTSQLDTLWLAALLVLGAMLLHFFSPRCAPSLSAAIPIQVCLPSPVAVALLLVLLAVGLRSFLGFALPVPWKSAQTDMIALVLAATFGKLAGGFLADRLGWNRVCSGMLAVAAVLVPTYRDSLPAACLAVCCLQMSTGVTLAALQASLPGRPAFAFGLNCLALLLGALPFLLSSIAALPAGAVFACCLVARLALNRALPKTKTKENRCSSEHSAAPCLP